MSSKKIRESVIETVTYSLLFTSNGKTLIMQHFSGNKTLLIISLVLAVFTVAIAIFSIHITKAAAITEKAGSNLLPAQSGEMFWESIPHHLIISLSY